MPFLSDYPRLQIIQDIAKEKKTTIYLVGGFLRDFLLQRKSLDFDFAVSRRAVAFARLFARRIRGAFVLLDPEHGCARVVKKDTGATWVYDFADFRTPTLKGDIAHRDFTINTFSLPLNKLSPRMEIDDLLEDLKGGRKDLRARRIRMVATKAFREDPLRLLRAFSLQAQLDFRIEPKTLAQIKKDRELIRNVSAERIREELFKILESEQAARNLKAMDRIGLLEKIIPQVTVMYHVRQGTYHHLDVWPHSLETIVQMEKLLPSLQANEDIRHYLEEPLGGLHSRWALMKLAALLHDVGKPESLRRDKGRVSFHGHERVGKGIARNVAGFLKLSTKQRFALQDMVLWHLRPGYLSNFKKPSERAVFRYFRDTGDEAVSIAVLSLADQRATRGPLTTESDQRHHERICRDIIERYFEKKKEKPFVRLINGNDLIRTLKLKPSPVFGRILRDVEERQATGKIRTKTEALALARRIAGKG